MYLFFDTETTGLPRNWKASVSNVKNWPRMIQIAWIACDIDGARISSNDFIIRPENFIIPKEASKIHGITTERAMDEGKNLKGVLAEFNGLVAQSKYLVAHNMGFDEKIVGAELLRTKIKSPFFKKKKLCTMLRATNYCRISGYYGYKWPTLSELHIKLFGEDFEGAHDASADIQATERCFWEMKRLNLI